MSDITDELLDELESLEHSTDDLNAKVKDANTLSAQLENTPNADTISTTALLLEACKSSQQAAQYSQETAEINLRTAQRQQQQLDDMQEIALSSRQAMRNANQESKSSKSFVSALSVTSILFVGGLAGMSSWFQYSSQQTQQSLEQQIIDIIKTENSLNQRHLNLKINELASIIELSVADIMNPPAQFDLQFELEGNDQQDQATPSVQQNLSSQNNNSSTPVSPITDRTDIALQIQTHQQSLMAAMAELKTQLNQLQNLPIAKTTAKESVAQPVQLDLSSLTPRFNSIDKQIKAQTAEIKALQTIIRHSSSTTTTTNPSSVITQNNEQNWQDIQNQMNTLSAQQKSMELVLEKLSESIKTMQQEINTPSGHYQYKNPYQYSN
jgi:hypothetical protein